MSLRIPEYPTTPDFNFTTHLPNNTNPYIGQCKWNILNTTLALFLALTILLNLAASFVLFRVPLVTVRGRSNPVYLCIRFLNITDLIQAVLLLLMPIFATPDCNWAGGMLSCRIMGFLALFLLLVSPLITILMAFDRVIALYQPFKYRSHLGLTMLKVLLPAACGFVLCTTILPIFGVGEYHVVRGRRMCLLDTNNDDRIDQIYALVVHSIFLCALLFMAACTVTFQLKLCRMNFDKKHQSQTNRKRRAGRTRNATITTMAVCCIFIICYLPYVIRVLAEASTGVKSSTWFTWLTFGLAFLQPMLNPVVYVATNVRYRQELLAMIRNMKTAEFETSSDSFASRGAFAEFRRRISSRQGSKRSSKRARSSQQGSVASPGVSRRDGDSSVRSARRNRRPSDDDVIDYGLPCSPVEKVVFHDRHRAVVRREPSSSSGIRSFDSHECLQRPNNLGRLASPSTEAPGFETCPRERSNTVTGEVRSPALNKIKAQTLEVSKLGQSLPFLGIKNTTPGGDLKLESFDKSPRPGRRCNSDVAKSDDETNERLNRDVTEPMTSSRDDVFVETERTNFVKDKVSETTQQANDSDDTTTSLLKHNDLLSSHDDEQKPSYRDSGVVDTLH
ncbi:uncharacterized protein LOC100182439 [Ciona intestinalis]